VEATVPRPKMCRRTRSARWILVEYAGTIVFAAAILCWLFLSVITLDRYGFAAAWIYAPGAGIGMAGVLFVYYWLRFFPFHPLGEQIAYSLALALLAGAAAFFIALFLSDFIDHIRHPGRRFVQTSNQALQLTADRCVTTLEFHERALHVSESRLRQR